MQTFDYLTRQTARLLALIAGISLLLMMLQTVADVIMSRIFQHPIEGNLEIVSAYHMVLVVFLPLAVVELRHEHINADLFVRVLPAAVQRAIYVFGCLVSLIFFGALFWQTGQDAIEAWRIDEVLMSSVYVLIWPAKFTLPIGFFAIMLAIVLHIVKAITDPDFDPTPPDPTTDLETDQAQ